MSVADFVPKRRVITAITNAQNAVATAANHGYASDEYVRINVPVSYGMRLGNIVAQITVINVNTFFLNVSTLLMDPFVVPGVPLTRSESVPISELLDNIAQ